MSLVALATQVADKVAETARSVDVMRRAGLVPFPRLDEGVRSLVALGNRVRVRVGPLTAEITAASAERLGLHEGDAVVASFKATAARLVPLS